MSVPTGTIQTYTLNVGTKLDVEDAIWLIDPYDVPLQGAMGADGRVSVSESSCFETKVEWLDENLLTPKSAAAGTVTTGATAVSVTSGTGKNFEVGDVLLDAATGEYVQISAIATDSLTITRGFNSSSATTITSGDKLVSVGSALAEGSDPGASRQVDRTDRFNYTQIFGPTQVQVSGTEQAVQKYGLTGTEFDHQIANRIKEKFINLEIASLYGTLQAGSSSVGRTMGGLTYFIVTNLDSSTTQFTDALLLTQLQKCFDAGGTPNRTLVGSLQKMRLSQLDSTLIRYAQDTNVRGQVVDFYDSDFGRQSIVLDRWANSTDAFIFSREQLEYRTLRPMQMEMLAKTGDSIHGQVVCEKTLMVRRPTWAARFSALT